MKKLLVFTLMLALLASCLVGCSQPTAPTLEEQKAAAAAVFTLDVNPGVRIYVNADDTVITVEATNEDGEAVVAELEVEGIDYETVVENIIDAMDERGYLAGDESSVLISVEKQVKDISEKVNEKINEAFEKHGKTASVIEQELDALDAEVKAAIGEMAEKYNISEGKAHLIEKIREEFPELSEQELAECKVNDLGMMLEDTSEDIKAHFKSIGKAVEEAYVGRAQALQAAVESLSIEVEDITMQRVRVTEEDGKILYAVTFVYDGMEYEIILDAASGEVLSTVSEVFEEFDAKGFLDDFCDKHNIDLGSLGDLGGLTDEILNGIFGKDESKGEISDKVLTKGELLKEVLTALNISEESLERTDVKLYETEGGTVFSVTVRMDGGDEYRLVVEAYSGAVLEAQLNGIAIDISATPVG